MAAPMPPARATPPRVFTPEELSAHDGNAPGRSVLIAYKGVIYDVSGRFMWMGGRHFWLHAGRDLTGKMSEAPHGEEILERVPRVGVLRAALGTDSGAAP
jgi:predicted heme/steroid binding protein